MKNVNETKHKIAVLVAELADTLEEVGANKAEALSIIEDCRNLQKKLEPVIDSLYGLKGLNKSTYLTDLQNRIDFIIKKHYKAITE